MHVIAVNNEGETNNSGNKHSIEAHLRSAVQHIFTDLPRYKSQKLYDGRGSNPQP